MIKVLFFLCLALLLCYFFAPEERKKTVRNNIKYYWKKLCDGVANILED